MSNLFVKGGYSNDNFGLCPLQGTSQQEPHVTMQF